jgi:hypothetical protein
MYALKILYALEGKPNLDFIGYGGLVFVADGSTSALNELLARDIRSPTARVRKQ